MQKIITVSLNGNAYQFEEPGYEALRAYMELAEEKLAGDPDTPEILRDLEQSIAEKCARFLGPAKSVVSIAEVSEILGEIGPVDRSPGNGSSAAHSASSSKSGPPKRLYKIREGAIASGVCNGLAAYLHVDPTIIRLAFVLGAFIEMIATDDPPWMTVVLYLALVFLVPSAGSSEQIGTATGDSIPDRVHAMVEKVKGRFSRQSAVGSR